MLNNRSQSKLRASSIAARVGDSCGCGKLAPGLKLAETILPCLLVLVETVIGGEIDNQALAAAQSLNEGLADSVGERQNPGIDLAILIQLSHLLRRQTLVDDLALAVALQLLALKFTGGDMSEIHHGVLVQKIDKSLTSVATGSNEANSRGSVIGGILHTQRRVRVGLGSVGQASGGREASSLCDSEASAEGDLGHGRNEGGGSGGNAAGAGAQGGGGSGQHDSDEERAQLTTVGSS